MTPEGTPAKAPAKKAPSKRAPASSNGSAKRTAAKRAAATRTSAPARAKGASKATNGTTKARSNGAAKARTNGATTASRATRSTATTAKKAAATRTARTVKPAGPAAAEVPVLDPGVEAPGAASNGAARSPSPTPPVERSQAGTGVPDDTMELRDRLAEIPDEPVTELTTVKVRPRDAPSLVAPEPTLHLAPVTSTSPALEPPLLACEGIDMAYGSVQIIFGVDFSIRENEIVALLGTNGAGKSTLLKGICGLVKPKRGKVHFDGKDITSLPADATAHRGISLMPGGKGVFPTLTVAENLRLAAWLIRKDHKRVAAARKEVLELFPVLRERSNQLAGDLSGGEQQMLALGGALMTRPKLLMIDELSLGLAPTVVGQLLDVVREIHARGTTIVLVEQSVNVALNLAERAVFMEKGEVRFEGAATELLERPDILRSVFIAGAVAHQDGDAHEGADAAPAVAATPASAPAPAAAEGVPLAQRPTMLECHGVVKRFGGIRAVDDVSFSLHDGEILGLIGHNGAGKTTLMDCISGFNELDGGRIGLRGMDITEWAPHERARGGLGRSFQDAMLFPTLTVAETLAVACERHLACRDFVAEVFRLPASYESELAVAIRVDELIDLMGLGAFRDKLTGELSTGSRRIVDLACILAQEPNVVMLDEPSAGVAQKETEALGPLLERVRERTGCSILIIEHDMPLLRSVCDTMVALELGHEITSGSPDDVLNHPQVIESYLGTDPAAINRSGAAAG